MILGTYWTTWRLVLVSSFRLFSRATGNRTMRHNHLPILWLCFYQFQYKITPNAIFIVIRQRQSFIVQVDIHFIVKALPQLSKHYIYISYILVTQQVLQVRSSLPFYFYRIYSSLFLIYYTIGLFPFFSPPSLSPILRDSIRDRLSLLGEIFTTLFPNTFYKFYAKRHGAQLL